MLAVSITRTISDIEVVWVLLAAFGLFYALRNAREAHQDVVVLTAATELDPSKERIARTTRFQDVARAVIHAICLVIGLLAMMLVDTSDSPSALIVAIGLTIRWGLIAVSAILVAQSYASNRLRVELLADERTRLLAEHNARELAASKAKERV